MFPSFWHFGMFSHQNDFIPSLHDDEKMMVGFKQQEFVWLRCEALVFWVPKTIPDNQFKFQAVCFNSIQPNSPTQSQITLHKIWSSLIRSVFKRILRWKINFSANEINMHRFSFLLSPFSFLLACHVALTFARYVSRATSVTFSPPAY